VSTLPFVATLALSPRHFGVIARHSTCEQERASPRSSLPRLLLLSLSSSLNIPHPISYLAQKRDRDRSGTRQTSPLRLSLPSIDSGRRKNRIDSLERPKATLDPSTPPSLSRQDLALLFGFSSSVLNASRIFVLSQVLYVFPSNTLSISRTRIRRRRHIYHALSTTIGELIKPVYIPLSRVLRVLSARTSTPLARRPGWRSVKADQAVQSPLKGGKARFGSTTFTWKSRDRDKEKESIRHDGHVSLLLSAPAADPRDPVRSDEPRGDCELCGVVLREVAMVRRSGGNAR
jgi:hypothetical protein